MKRVIITTMAAVIWLKTASSAEPMPFTTRSTEVNYYFKSFDWNEAHDKCQLSGGHLLQAETALQYSYTKSIVKQLRKMRNSDQTMEIWLGLIVPNPPADEQVWVEGCRPLCYAEFGPGEPNNMNSDFCIRLYYTVNEPEASHNFEWRTLECGYKNGYICMRESDTVCPFNEISRTALSVTSVDSETYNIDKEQCEQYCSFRTVNGLECWAYTYRGLTAECKLFYLADPYLLTDSYHVTDSKSVLAIKNCFQLSLYSNSSSDATGNNNPNTPCFKSPVLPCVGSSTEAPSTTSAAPYNITERSNWTSSLTPTQTSTPLPTSSKTSLPKTNQPSLSKSTQLASATPAQISTQTAFPISSWSSPETPLRAATEHPITTATSTDTSATPMATTSGTSVSYAVTSKSWTTADLLTSTTTSLTTTTTLPRTAPTPGKRRCLCPCVKRPVNVSKEIFTQKLIEGLEIDKTNLSSTRRKLISVYERRTVPIAVGSVWLGLLISMYAVIFISDFWSYRKPFMAASNTWFDHYYQHKIRPIKKQVMPSSDDKSSTGELHEPGITYTVM